MHTNAILTSQWLCHAIICERVFSEAAGYGVCRYDFQYARATSSRSVSVVFSWCAEGLNELKIAGKHLRPRSFSAATLWCASPRLVSRIRALNRATSGQKRFQLTTRHGTSGPVRSEVPATGRPRWHGDHSKRTPTARTATRRPSRTHLRK